MKRDPVIAAAARRLNRRLEALGRVSDERNGLTRTYLSPAMGRANRLVGAWMRAAGLAVREDAFGNLIGRREPDGRRNARTLVIGSHLDTVRDAGRFDGAAGVLLALAAVEAVAAAKCPLPFAVEVVGFAEEEGVRFASGYIGSKGYIGRLGARELGLRDEQGVALRDVLAGRKERARGTAGRSRPEFLGYIEAHIEQGPVLEALGAGVGVVSGIAGQTRGKVVFRGRAGHAGTVPMKLRRDALAGAAEWIGAVEAAARRRPPLVATVGTIAARPGAPNVIPAEVQLSLDVRDPSDARRRAALRGLLAKARAIARKRGLTVGWTPTQDNGATECDPRLRSVLAGAARSVQGRAPVLVSGAGHDGVVLAERMPVAMLFIRCRGGVSHHPSEFASARDLRTALEVLTAALRRLGAAPWERFKP